VKKNKREVIPLNEKLTPKQEKFIQNVVSGMSQREAYKDAYNAENMKDETIDAEACKLFNDHKVATRYKELMEELKDKAIMTAKERMIWLTNVINGNIKEVVAVQKTNCETGESEMVETEFPSQLKTKLVALDTLNKMSGEYVTKIDADVNSDVTINIELTDD
jgi:phage terminase small subunit